ncbi:hypothetical protein Clacol_009185 [Clathrus columnatus]|uniref:RNI-like protein n=1 Tax=Clathrus columnatus TaxID=1419009 RepID=A0AAV5AQ20_9AGAM|nr:hypothetical protein Clacol_009185 [Clathrus columnatus]
MSRNNVRGPTSALTEFLREQGISARSIVQRRRAEANNNAEAGPSNNANATVENTEDVGQNEMDGENGVEDPVQASVGRRKRRKSGYNSDALDGSDKQPSVSKKRKLTKAQMETLKAKEKKKAKGRRKGNDSDDSEDSDIYNALSKGGFNNVGASKAPLPGTIVDCVECSKKFTVTKYTIPSREKSGLLCHVCVKSSGVDPFKKTPVPRKRKDPAEKRKVISFEEPERVNTLASMCIDVIGKHIEDVEALGDIGTLNMDKIAKLIAKNRNLQNDAFCTLSSLNPNLHSLRLDFCGRLTDNALVHWAEHLPSLTRIELLGPFLVRVEGWKAFLERLGPQLQGFLITQSPRFDESCLEILTNVATNLTELRFSEFGKLSDDWVESLGKLTNLTSLDISYPSTSLNDDALVTLLNSLGSNLTHLNLSGNSDLSDVTLLTGILPNMKRLDSLSLANVPLVTDAGLAQLFTEWTDNPPLENIDLSRNHLAGSSALEALLTHSGQVLTTLNINGWKDASTTVLLDIGKKAPGLVKIDLGWCRGVDNFVIKELLDACGNLQEVKCYGCNRVTTDCPQRALLKIFGVEGHSRN